MFAAVWVSPCPNETMSKNTCRRQRLQTHRLDEAIGAVRAVIEASSLPTRDIGRWRQASDHHRTSCDKRLGGWTYWRMPSKRTPDCKQQHH